MSIYALMWTVQDPFISLGLPKDSRKISSTAHAHRKGCSFPAMSSNQGSRIQFEVRKGTAPIGQTTLIPEVGQDECGIVSKT